MPPEQDENALDVPSPDQEVGFDLSEDDKETTVELTETEDGKVVAKIQEETEQEPERQTNEHEEYSSRVKKRISTLTAKAREAERQREAALQYAQAVQQQLVALQQRTQSLDQGYLTESEGRIQSQMSIVEANLQDAVERGDGKAAVEAQKLMSQLILQQERIKAAKAQAVVERQKPVAQPVAQQPVQQPAPRPVDTKAEAWAAKHEWFGTDTAMTNAAFGIHSELEQEGFDLSSDEYYDELDARMRQAFPHKFRKAPQVDTSNVRAVAPATRGTSVTAGRKQIKLTPSEVAMARRIGVPLEEYAKHVRR